MFTITYLEPDPDYLGGEYNKKWIGTSDDGGDVEIYWHYTAGEIHVWLDNQKQGSVLKIAGDIDEAKMIRLIKRNGIAQVQEGDDS